MRDYREEFEKRVDFIKGVLKNSGAAGIVYGNSGGKDSALVGILCKAACPNTVGIIMPCASKRNFGEDRDDGIAVAEQFDIETRTIDLTPVREAELEALKGITDANPSAVTNIAPRLRMITLYAVAASENMLVAGTGNRSEYYMGYFTKWGDGAHDFNPIADLTVTEIYEFLRWLKAPTFLLQKAPSAGLFDEQTDEAEMGVTYKAIDNFLLNNRVGGKEMEIIESFHRRSLHKLRPISTFENP